MDAGANSMPHEWVGISKVERERRGGGYLVPTIALQSAAFHTGTACDLDISVLPSTAKTTCTASRMRSPL
jgi:hypothetical protein